MLPETVGTGAAGTAGLSRERARFPGIFGERRRFSAKAMGAA